MSSSDELSRSDSEDNRKKSRLVKRKDLEEYRSQRASLRAEEPEQKEPQPKPSAPPKHIYATDAEALAAQLFGDISGENALAVPLEPDREQGAPQPSRSRSMSSESGDSLDDFIYRDTRVTADDQASDGASEYDEDILADIRDVFGDLRVLQLRHISHKPKAPAIRQPSPERPAVHVVQDAVEVIDESELAREAQWLWGVLRPDAHEKSLWIRACEMFLRDWLVRGFGYQFIRRHLVSAKYFSVLSEPQMEEIVTRLHDEWRELAAWSSKLGDSVARFRDTLENPPFDVNADVLGLADVLELSRAVAHWSSVLEISQAEPGPDFRSVLISVQSGLTNFLDPVRRALFPEAETEAPASKLRRRDSAGIGVFNELAKEPGATADKLVQVFSVLNCRPSDLGRICAGQLGISGRGGFVSGVGIATATQQAVSVLLSSDFSFRMYVRHELLRRASVYVVPLKPLTMADAQYVHRRVLARSIGSFLGSSDFLEYVDLENRGDVRVCVAMTTGGVVAECRGPVLGAVSAEHVGKHIWACAQLHALKQAEQTGRSSDQISEDHVRGCVVADPIYSNILNRLLAPHEISGDSERGRMVQAIVREALHSVYTELYSEIKQELTQQAEVVVAKRSADSLVAKVGKRGWVAENLPSDLLENLGARQREAVFRACLGEYTVASVVPEPRGGLRVVVVNSVGDQVATYSFVFLLDRQMSADKRKTDEEKKLTDLLSEFKVAAVAVSTDFESFRIKAITRCFEDLMRASEDQFLKRFPKIVLVSDVHVAGVLPEHRGVEVGRFLQNPLAETMRLWNEDLDRNVLLSVTFHPLQHLVTKVKVHAYMRFAIAQVVAALGSLDVIRITRAPWRGTVLQFLPCMTAMKAEILLKSRDFRRNTADASSDSEVDVPRSQQPRRGWQDIVDEKTWKNIEPFLPRVPETSRLISVLKETRQNLKVINPSRSEDPVELGGLVLTKSEFLAALPSDDAESVLLTLGIPRDMWPLVAPLLQVLTNDADIVRAVCSNLMRTQHAVDLNLFVRDVVESADVPDYLKDAEIDRQLLESNGELYLKHVLLEAISRPYRSRVDKLHSLSEEQVFELQLGPGGLGQFSFLAIHRLRVVKDDGRWSSLRFVDLPIDGALKRAASGVWTPNDRVMARLVGLESARQQAVLSIDPPIAAELRDLARLSPDTLVLKADMAVYSSLGREAGPVGSGKGGQSSSAGGPMRARRVIRHENYFAELDHGMALVKLKDAALGEVVFRPSKSKSNLLIGMIKIKEPVDVVRQDWLKVYQFTEEPSARNPNKMVYKLKGAADAAKNEEFEELDQIKAVLVERYMRYLADFKQHSRFRPETLEQVRNLVNAEFMTDAKGHVAYHFALDERPEFAGNGVLLWCAQGTKVKEEPVAITHRGFRLWNRGPFTTLNQLITWWKTDGFAKRSVYLAEWQASLAKMT